MPTRAFVPASLPAEATDPLTWPQVTIVGAQLVVPGAGPIRTLQGVFVLGWHLIMHDDCIRGACLATVVEMDDVWCCRTAQSREDRMQAYGFPAFDLRACVQGIEIAVAVRIAGQLDRLVVLGGVAAAVDVAVAELGSDPDSDRCRALAVQDGQLRVGYDDDAPSSTRVHWLQRNLAFPPGWEKHPDRTIDPFDGVCAMLKARDPFNPADECDDPPLDPYCTSCGGSVESTDSPPWWHCNGCGWP